METKVWWQSKTIIGAIITVISIILQAFGYNLAADDQATLTDIMVTVFGIGGGILTIYGRVKASKQITG